MEGCILYCTSSIIDGTTPSSVSLSNRLIPRPFSCASRLVMTGERKYSKELVRLTPRIKGMSDAGSVDMEASSKNTTGKSRILSAALADVMHVVQIFQGVQ
jgi:hypothetical protein